MSSKGLCQKPIPRCVAWTILELLVGVPSAMRSRFEPHWDSRPWMNRPGTRVQGPALVPRGVALVTPLGSVLREMDTGRLRPCPSSSFHPYPPSQCRRTSQFPGHAGPLVSRARFLRLSETGQLEDKLSQPLGLRPWSRLMWFGAASKPGG